MTPRPLLLRLLPALVLSCALCTVAVRASVGPLARWGAKWLAPLQTLVPAAAGTADVPPTGDLRTQDGRLGAASEDGSAALAIRDERASGLSSDDGSPSAGAAHSARAPVTGSQAHGSSPARKVLRMFVGPELVQRAAAPSGRPTASFVGPSQEHPAGVAFQSTGALAGTVHSGDILIRAEGQPIVSLEQLIAVVGKSYERRTRYVTGRLWRRGETFEVTVEPGW